MESRREETHSPLAHLIMVKQFKLVYDMGNNNGCSSICAPLFTVYVFNWLSQYSFKFLV